MSPTLLICALLGVGLFAAWRGRRRLARGLLRLLIWPRYRLHVLGPGRVPRQGAVLLLGNHLSFIDWAVLQLVCPRPIHFVMDRSLPEPWVWRVLLWLIGVTGRGAEIPLQEIRIHLQAGEVVAFFPEGTLSRTGHLGEFRRDYESVVRGLVGVLVPFYLHGLWGTRVSLANAPLRVMRRRRWRHEVGITFGESLPLETTAEALKRRMFTLSIAAWDRYTRTLGTVPEAWLSSAKRRGRRWLLADTLSGRLSGYRVIAGVLIIAGLIKRHAEGPHIGVLLPTSNGGTLANLAILLRGKTVVNLNYTASAEAIAAALRLAEIKTVFTSSRFIERLAERGIDVPTLLAGVQVYRLEALGAGIGQGQRLWTLLQAICLPAWILRALYAVRVSPDSVAAILFSSGSEGEPKGILLSHRNLMGNIKQVTDLLNPEVGDVLMATLPSFHAFGLTVTMLMPMVEGIPVVGHPDPADVVNIARAVAAYRGTILFGTATFLHLYVRNPRVHPLMLESLRLVVAGAEKLTAAVREAFRTKFGKEIYEGYGATETAPVASVNVPDRLHPMSWSVQCGHKPGTVGLPLPGTSFRIVDPETLADLPHGTAGLLLIGGVQVMLGYLGGPVRTAQAILTHEGLRWYKTGDKGSVDEAGFLTLVDRYSRFAKLGGEMVSLTAVETQIRGVLAAPDLEICAVSLSGARRGEEIVLLIAGQEIDPHSLRRQLLAAGCSPLTIPTEYHQVPEIPTLGSGKTDFGAARALALVLR